MLANEQADKTGITFSTSNSCESLRLFELCVFLFVMHVVEKNIFASLIDHKLTENPLLVAVSGGADSVALLRVLDRVYSGQLHVLHVNHQLRGESSDQDERFVQQLCDDLGIQSSMNRVHIAGDGSQGIEETARDVRLELLEKVAVRFSIASAVTAHTADDNVETILHRIIRGASFHGLQGIPPVRSLGSGVQLLRPMLGCRRSEVLEYLCELNQPYCTDATNEENQFTRNRIRNELLPYVREHFNPRVDDSILRLGEFAREMDQVLTELVTPLRRSIIKKDHTAIELNAAELDGVRPFLVGEFIRRTLKEENWPLKEIGQREIERIVDLIQGQGRAWDLAGGIHVRRRRKRVTIERTPRLLS